jgi:peptide/nickel transport system substrate-binding protein
MYGRYFTSTGNLNEVAGYSSDTLDELFAAGKASTDPDERAGIYEQISAELENNAAWIWLFTSYTYTATTADVTGFIPMANGSLQYLRVTSLG